MNTNIDTTTQSQLAWPLPGTHIAHAHLTWAEWITKQAANVASAHYVAPMPMGLDQQSTVMYLARGGESHLTWPLPATKLPNAHLSWAEWLDAQSNTPTAKQPGQGAFERAA
jgi:hypothetical protein